jgi:pimeloyl-ACP methyl ester carboxylesterase
MSAFDVRYRTVDLIPQLADRYRVLAPDLPGFGSTTAPARDAYARLRCAGRLSPRRRPAASDCGDPRMQYTHGVPADKLERISPDAIGHAQAIIDRDPELQLDLFGDYQHAGRFTSLNYGTPAAGC